MTMSTEHKDLIASMLYDAIHNLLNVQKICSGKMPTLTSIKISQSKLESHGDLSCNIALQLAPLFKINACVLAKSIISYLNNQTSAHKLIQKIEVAGQGFINIWLRIEKKQEIIYQILKTGSEFGKSNKMKNCRLILEYVSANPTGPLHVGHARQAILGDTLARLFLTQGANVWREFYYNDTGNQIENLVDSILARLKHIKPGDVNWPKDGYSGTYIQEIAELYRKTDNYKNSVRSCNIKQDEKQRQLIRQFAINYLRLEQDHDLSSIDVKFDNYFLESSLHKTNKVQAIIEQLNASGHTYKHDNALWLRSTTFGDDKDRVIIKSDGTYTYCIPDITYHVDKWQRGFKKAINIQGSDHHSTITRVRAGLQALNIGVPADYPSYILHSMVRVIKNNTEVKISKRAGNYVTIRDLVTWTSEKHDACRETTTHLPGKDAVRFFLLSRKADTEFLFDVDLAIKNNDENPVYYVQYACARIFSVLERWGGELNTLQHANLTPIATSTSATNLLKILNQFPSMLERAAEEYSPHYLPFYARNLASNLHTFYNTEHILVEKETEKLAKLALLAATGQVLKQVLHIMGVSAPNKM